MHTQYRPFSLFLAGQGILSLGESIRFIAVMLLIYKVAGSGISAAAGVALSALPSILISPFAGVAGDRVNESRMLIFIDMARFLVIPLFLHVELIEHIYLLLVLISVFDVFYGPSRKKLILAMTGKKGALKANSQLAGINGAAYIAGPLLAGFLTDSFGPAPAVIIAGVCCFVSCLMTLLSVILKSGRTTFSAVIHEDTITQIWDTIRYCRTSRQMRELLAIGTVVGFCVISVNLSFHAYAFDLMRVTPKGWSLMISIYYGTNLIAMPVALYAGRMFAGRERRLLYAVFIIVSVIWLIYAFTVNYWTVLLLQFMEGVAAAVGGILLAAGFQSIVDKRYVAKVSGMSDILSSAGKLGGIACTALVNRAFSLSGVFIVNSMALLLFCCAGWLRAKPLQQHNHVRSL